MEKSNKKVAKKKTSKKVSTTTKKPKLVVEDKAKAKKKNVKSKAVNNTKVKAEVKRPLKKEKWYIWLKNNIIENEEKYSKEYKSRRFIVALFMVFCFFTVLFSAAIADYNYAYKNNKEPLLVLRARDEYKQATIYYGMFYKAWKCDNGFDHVSFSRYKSEISYCTLVASYNNDDIYVNPNGVKITESQMNIINNYYYDYYVYFKTEKDLENAYTISKEINKNWWVKKASEELIDDDEAINLAIFGKVENKNGVDEWNIQYDDPNYYKCVKNVNGSNLFATYNHLDNTCDNNWEALSLNEGTCSLISTDENSIFVQNLVKLTGLCK